MTTNFPENIVLPKLATLIDSSMNFVSEYETALQTFHRNSAMSRLIAEKSLDDLEEQFDLNRKTLDEATQSLFVDWTHSTEYNELRTRFDGLLVESRAVLKLAYLGAPRLTEVQRTSRLPTKAKRLTDRLEISREEIQRWLAQGRQLPIARVPASAKHPQSLLPKSAALEPKSWRTLFPKTWWEWLGIVVGFAALVYYLPTLLGVSRLTAVVVGLVVVGFLVGLDMVGRRSMAGRSHHS